MDKGNLIQLEINNSETVNKDEKSQKITDTKKESLKLQEKVVESPKKANKELTKSTDVYLELPRISINLDQKPLVLAAHLVPSLPISLFEILAELIEEAIGKPVVILFESRIDRPVAEQVTDIAILPPDKDWINGNLLPVSFVFEHRLNKDFSPGIYADLVIATDRAPHVDKVLDLRGHRCGFPDRNRKSGGVSSLLFNYLRSKGESPTFFGNILDADSQLGALQMVANRQVEICVLESPVFKFHKRTMPESYSLQILNSFGPLAPYQIMINKNIHDDQIQQITKYLLNVHNNKKWSQKFSPFSLLGFTKYSKNMFQNIKNKSAVTSVPYY